jgi:3-oxoacyl-[acyl-carrier protein] reductase
MKKKVLVTGASGGIGRSISETLIQDYELILVGRDKSKLEKVLENNQSVLGRIPCDLKNINEIHGLEDELNRSNLKIDILINNAGITDDSLFIRMNLEKWQNVMKTNLDSNFILTNKISKQMIKNKWGRIINITSVVGHTGNIGQANYCAAKSGIIGMSKSIASELAKWNITVNCISPGFIKTNMTDSLSEENKKLITQKIPLGRIGLPDDVAKCVKFLVSDDSNYITGETIHINGGMAML